MSETLFTNVSIIDGTGGKPFEGSVLVHGNRIAAVSRDNGLESSDAEIVDGGGAILMPGLIDAHAHLSFLDAGTLGDINALSPELIAELARRGVVLAGIDTPSIDTSHCLQLSTPSCEGRASGRRARNGRNTLQTPNKRESEKMSSRNTS